MKILFSEQIAQIGERNSASLRSAYFRNIFYNSILENVRGISRQRCEILSFRGFVRRLFTRFPACKLQFTADIALKAYFIALHSALSRFFIVYLSLLFTVYATILDKQRVYLTESFFFLFFFFPPTNESATCVALS